MYMQNKPSLRLICVLLVIVLCTALLPGFSGRPHADAAEDSGIIPDEIILSFRASATPEEISEYLSGLDAVPDGALADIGIYRLTLPAPLDTRSLDALAASLRADEIVEAAYLNTVTNLIPASASATGYYFPNDPWGGDSWDTEIADGKNWHMEAIEAPGAWMYLDHMTPVNVGIIEGDIPNHQHPDLEGLFVNRQYLYIDKKGNLTEMDPNSEKPGRHSTRVAGIINAKFDNGEGVSGVMGGMGRLYSYSLGQHDKLSDETYHNGTVAAYTYLTALKALIDQDVQVINISMGSYLACYAASHGDRTALAHFDRQVELATEVLSRIIEERTAQGKPDFVIVVGAGNANDDTFYKDSSAYMGYRSKMTLQEIVRDQFGKDLPNRVRGGALAKYSHFLNAIEEPAIKDRIIVVGAVELDSKNSTSTQTKYRYTDFSDIGDRVDLVAPGSKTYGCTTNGYGTFGGSGTSFAAPHVSGVAGLVFACDPTLSGPRVKQILMSTATGSYDRGDGSCGMVNANLAVYKTLEFLAEGSVEDDQEATVDAPAVIPPSTTMTDAERWDAMKQVYYDFLHNNRFIHYLQNPFIKEAWQEYPIDNYYIFRDLDSDGYPELIIWHGYTGADGEVQIFTIGTGDSVSYSGSAACDGTGTHLFCADHDDDFFLESYDGFAPYGNGYRLVNGKLVLTAEGSVAPQRWYCVDPDGYLPLDVPHQFEFPAIPADS